LITRDLLKDEIDNVQDNYLDILYQIIRALENPPAFEYSCLEISNWKDFINKTYGCMSDVPIDRAEQGLYEIREAIG